MEPGQPGGFLRWLKTLLNLALGVQLVEALLFGPDSVREEMLWTSDLPCVCIVPNDPSIPPNTRKYTKAEAHRQGVYLSA